jgi:hypothetical protein
MSIGFPIRNAKGPDALAKDKEVDPTFPEQVASNGESIVLDEIVRGPS